MSFLSTLNLAPTPASPAARASMPAQVFEALRRLVYDETGIFFQDNKQYLLESRVGRRMRELGLESYDQYLALVRRGTAAVPELTQLFNCVTINETYFFRNTAQFEVIENDLLPALAAAREQSGTRRVRIWSAACSTGDEPYTLAMLIRERLAPRFPSVRFEIVGTDLNTDVLATAQRGHFGEYAVRNVPQPFLRKYFRQDGDTYVLDDAIRQMVTFRSLNLSDRRGMQAMRGFDVILCANVLIYFDDASKQQVVAGLYNSLSPDGYLLVGFSETLYGVTQAFRPVRYSKTIAYQKVDRHA